MDLCTPEGEKVIFLGTGGYPGDLEAVKKVLTKGVRYIVEGVEIGNSSSVVHLKGFHRPFNTVQFENLPDYDEEQQDAEDRTCIFNERCDYI